VPLARPGPVVAGATHRQGRADAARDVLHNRGGHIGDEDGVPEALIGFQDDEEADPRACAFRGRVGQRYLLPCRRVNGGKVLQRKRQNSEHTLFIAYDLL